MTGTDECSCNDRDREGACRVCGIDEPLPYWCETCERPVAEKRCPCCGLKARKMAGRTGR